MNEQLKSQNRSGSTTTTTVGVATATTTTSNGNSHNHHNESTVSEQQLNYKRTNIRGSLSFIDKTITEESIREDFLTIVRDLEDRALFFINQQTEVSFLTLFLSFSS